jgi:hypothetical protein
MSPPSGAVRRSDMKAENSGAKCYFFKGNQYVRVTRGETGPGTADSGYLANISNWGWPAGFGTQ